MRYTALSVFLAASSLAMNAAHSAADTKPVDAFARLRPAIVTVVSVDANGKMISKGGGFIAKEDGLIITSWRAVSGAAKIKISRINAPTLLADGIVGSDPSRDFALLKVNTKDRLPAIPLGDSDSVRKGDKVIILKSALAASSGTTEGTVNALCTLPRAPKLMQVTAAVSPDGNGNPVVNSQGQAVGFAIYRSIPGQHLNVAMPINPVKQRIAAGGKPIPVAQASRDDASQNAGVLFLRGVFALLEGNSTSPEGRKRIEAALTCFQQVTEKRKDYVEGYFYSGYCLGELGRNQEATKSFKQAIAIKPDYAEAYFGLGVACVNLGWNQEAIEDFKQAIRLRTDYADAHYNLGLAYINLGWTQEAVESFKQAIRINPEYSEAHYNLGVAYVQMGRNQDAAESFKQAVRINPEQAQAQFGLGVALSNMGKDEEASEVFKQAIRIRPDYAEAHFGLGIAYLNLGKAQEAGDSFKQAIRIKPDDPEAHYNLGLAYDKLGSKQEAAESFRQAIRLKPDYADAHYNLAVNYIGQQDRGRALDEYKILKDLDSDMAAKVFKLIYP